MSLEVRRDTLKRLLARMLDTSTQEILRKSV
jgi:hypothetical protein